MLDIAISPPGARVLAVALPIRSGVGTGTIEPTEWSLTAPVAAEVDEFLVDVGHQGTAGIVHILPRPSREPGHVVLVGIGNGDAAGWREAGAAVARACADRLAAVTMALPAGSARVAAREFALGAWLATYRFRLGTDSADAPKLRRISLLTGADKAGPNNAGPNNAGPNNAGPSNAGPSNAGPSNAGPSNAGPSKAGPSNASPGTAGRGKGGKVSAAKVGGATAGGAKAGGAKAGGAKAGWAAAGHVDAGEIEAGRAALAEARAITDAVVLARDLTNTPSLQKSPSWFADRVANAAARRKGVSVAVLDETDLANAGFGGLLAVGGGSDRPPRLVELSWRPRGAKRHVVLVGKGICFDSGGVSIKPLDGMKLMRKDMGGAAAVCAAVLGAADLEIPVRVTALAPLAENMVSGAAMRPGDVIRHYGGATTEILDTDAEGRLVLADALAYGARRLKPDYLIDLATLTGASHVALGKRTAALFSPDAVLSAELRAAGEEVGEPVWPLPLADEYLGLLRSDVADLANIGQPAQAGAVVAALFLREFTGDRRDRWAHIDMSAPAWIDRNDGPLVKGATGWGVQILLRWLRALCSG